MAKALDNTDKDSLFRKNAENVGVTSVSAIGEKLQRVGKAGFAKNDPRMDDDERDEFGKKKKKKFELAGNSDEAQLARSSGNFNIGETWEEYGSNPVTIQHEMEADSAKAIAFHEEQSFFDSVYDTASDWYDTAADYGSGIYDDICTKADEAGKWLTEVGNEAWDGVKGVWETTSTAVTDASTAITEGFKNYISQPVEKAWEATKEAASTAGTAIADGYNNYIAQPAGKAWEATKEVASNVGTAVSNTASSIATSVSETAASVGTSIANTASRAGTAISSGWSSLKNFALGESKPADTQTAETQKPAVVQTLAQPEEKPAALVGENNDVKPTSAPSLGSAFGSAAAGPSQVADAAPTVPTPRPVPAPTPAPATMPM